MADTTDQAHEVLAARTPKGPAAGQREWSKLARSLPIVPLAILVPYLLIAIFAGVIAPYDPTEPIPGAKIFEPPVWSAGGSAHALLGTDFQGRDVLSRLIF